jgi:hypothetical protein
VTRRFKPSAFSEGANEKEDAKSLAMKLRYIRKAAELLEEEMTKSELPPWVARSVNQAAALMGTAVSYVKFAREKRGEKKPQRKRKKR